MSFGERFGQLVRKKRAIEGLSQKRLAELVYDDGAYKTRVSELENGKTRKPQAKTIDAYVVALNILPEEFSEVLSEEPHPSYYDNLTDFFSVPKDQRLDIEIAIKETGIAVFIFSYPMKVKIKRLEFFVSERTLLWVTESQKRRPVGLPLSEKLSDLLKDYDKIRFVHHDLLSKVEIDHGDYELKVIH